MQIQEYTHLIRRKQGLFPACYDLELLYGPDIGRSAVERRKGFLYIVGQCVGVHLSGTCKDIKDCEPA